MLLSRMRVRLLGLQPLSLPWRQTSSRLLSDKATPASQNVRDQNPKRDGPRHVPTEAELGSEREIKWGVNIPNTAEQLLEEAKYAGKGIVGAAGAAASSILTAAQEQIEEVKRTTGVQTHSKAMSNEDMGAAGRMQQPPPHDVDGVPEDRARAKYGDIKETVASHFPDGESSITEQWRRAGHQNCPDTAAGLAVPTQDRKSTGEMDESKDTGSGTIENLHYRGP